MNPRRSLSVLALALSTALPLTIPTTAFAQTPSTWQSTRITSVAVEPVQRLRGGETLVFDVRATPGAVVTLDIDGGAKGVPLSEVEPGSYRGEYVIRRNDKLSATSQVTARATRDGRTSVATLGTSLQAGAPALANGAAAQITGFAIDAPERVRPGDELRFSLNGPAGGKARVQLNGVAQPIALSESSRGVYQGSYVLRRNDRVAAGLAATAYVDQGGRTTSQRFERAAAAGNGSRADERGARVGAAQQACVGCGSVQSVDVVKVDGNSSNAAGTIAGGVIGGVIGNQVGDGRGKDLARIVGAIGGAYAGNRVQNRMDKNEVYRVAVRLDNGETRNFDYPNDPAVAVGTRVRVEDDVLIRL